MVCRHCASLNLTVLHLNQHSGQRVHLDKPTILLTAVDNLTDRADRNFRQFDDRVCTRTQPLLQYSNRDYRRHCAIELKYDQSKIDSRVSIPIECGRDLISDSHWHVLIVVRYADSSEGRFLYRVRWFMCW